MLGFFKRHWKLFVGLAACAASLCFLAFVEPLSYCRFLLSCQTFWFRLVRVFKYLFLKESVSVTMMGRFPWSGSSFLVDFGGFFADVAWFFRLFGSGMSWLSWLSFAVTALTDLFQGLMLFVLVWLLAKILFKDYFAESGIEWSRASKNSLRFEDFVYRKAPGLWLWLKERFAGFLRSRYFVFVFVVLAFAFNVFSFGLDLASGYFSLMLSLDFLGFVDGLTAFVFSVLYSVSFVPVWVWACLAYVLVRRATARRADDKGRAMILFDRKVVNDETGLFLLLLGMMRGGKTTVGQSVTRIKEVIFRGNTLDNMDRIKSYFPAFPFIAFEHFICYSTFHTRKGIHNIEQAAASVKPFLKRFKREGKAVYDLKVMPTHYFDGAIDLRLGDAMAIYAESYWVYFYPSSLIGGNIPVRSDNIRLDKGHLVLWDEDWFGHSNLNIWDYSYLSHDLDFDALRFGRKVDPNSPFVDCSGPSVVFMTEFGKEYGNQNKNSTVKADDEESNSKNDMMDMVIKLGGHLANVWHENLFALVADEQYSGSLAAQLTNIAQSVFVLSRKNTKEGCALSLFWIEPIVLDWVIKASSSFLRKYEFAREDRTLLYSVIASVRHLAVGIEARIVNRWGFKEITIPETASDSQGNFQEAGSTRFYTLNKIDYAERFESACMKDFLNRKKLAATKGFFDLPTFNGLMPSPEEWAFQRSHLVEELSDPENAARIRARKTRESADKTPFAKTPDGASEGEGGRFSGKGESVHE